jgi:hypothetical protein
LNSTLNVSGATLLRSNLNVSGTATLNNLTIKGTLTGATFTKSLIGLDNVANTAPSDLPISTATQTALNLLLPIQYASQYSLTFDDFTGQPSLTASFTGLSNYAFISQSGATLGVTNTQYPNSVGVYSASTGTTATTGNAALYGRYIFLGQGAIKIEARATLINASALAQRYFYRHGLVSAVTEAGTTDGIYFRYIDTENSGNLVCVCRAASVETVVNTAIAPSISVMQKLRIEVNAAGTSAQFFIAGVSVATIATNIPANNIFSF